MHGVRVAPVDSPTKVAGLTDQSFFDHALLFLADTKAKV
jgi:hypothetical protein